MPQGRRKVPFSGKAKREQLKDKRHNKKVSAIWRDDESHVKKVDESKKETRDVADDVTNVIKINEQPTKSGSRSNPNRYVLQFHRETREQLQAQRQKCNTTLVPVPEEQLEADIDDYFVPGLEFPKRPPWNFGMSREELDAREHRYFTEYIQDIQRKFDWKELSYFELNLETWRQLWRVVEMSDIILVIVDIRYPALMFPPSLYDFVTAKLNKSMILVLNKVDLAPAPLVVAWKEYLHTKFPELTILHFTSFPTYNLRGNTNEKKGGLQKRKRKGKLRMSAEGAQKLYEACKEIVQDEVDLSSWQKKISEEMLLEYEVEGVEIEESIDLQKVDTSFVEHVKYKEGVLTIGCIGQPNVGKSSLMNAIMGKKVVSVSKTPGHTKHFQTIYLTPHVRLCDCPGLVFPSKVPKNLQVLMGSYPIAQLRDPYSAIMYVAERIDLVKLLKLQHPEADDTWSAMDICEAFAQKRGFYTARAGRLDAYRGANYLLRLCLDGEISLCLRPPEYTKRKNYWHKHPEVEVVRWIQAQSEDVPYVKEPMLLSDDDDDIPAKKPNTTVKRGAASQASSQDEEEEDCSEEAEDEEEESSEEERAPANKFDLLNDDD